jgi:hypothetical protein
MCLCERSFPFLAARRHCVNDSLRVRLHGSDEGHWGDCRCTEDTDSGGLAVGKRFRFRRIQRLGAGLKLGRHIRGSEFHCADAADEAEH